MLRLLPQGDRPRLALVVVIAVLLGGALPVVPGWAQDSGAASFTPLRDPSALPGAY